MNGKQILVVEDDALPGQDLRLRRESFGYEVPVVASTGAEAIRVAAELQPDLMRYKNHAAC